MAPIAFAAPSASQDGSAPHPGDKCWGRLMAKIHALLQQRSVHPSRAVVLLPYAQLMPQAKLAWIAHEEQAGRAASFMPGFETTMNWAGRLNAEAIESETSSDDLRMDAAIDTLTAASLLDRAGFAGKKNLLAGRLVEAAWSLAKVAAAQPPWQRTAWGAGLAPQLANGLESPALALEAAISAIALAWASSSSYPSDPLFSARPDLLVTLEGFQSEPLTAALVAHSGDRAVALKLERPDLAGMVSLHLAHDAEDEAERAAACVIAHLVQRRTPVALIAQDRVLTRRIRAMLGERGVPLRDETGWKLSTTRAAATLMSLLRIFAWDASGDTVLDWLKNAPAFDTGSVTQLETFLRSNGVRLWRTVGRLKPLQPGALALAEKIDTLRLAMQRARPLAAWLRDLRTALESAGQWDGLAGDSAGSAVLLALHIEDASDLDRPAAFRTEVRMSVNEFTSWASQALEAASFSPLHPAEAQVVILPLSQLLGRPMQAVVLPGADEVRLAVSPEPAGPWTPGQRELLGLLSRAELAQALRDAWEYALCMPHVDVLWRNSEAGEKILPSGFVQQLRLDQALEISTDPRASREVAPRPTPRPLPTSQALEVVRLSASAYEDLRRCPYRFFALRQLGLHQDEELETELGKREFGNWLHTLLHYFHEALKTDPAFDLSDQVAMINIASEKAKVDLALSDSEFLPFAAIWPRVRDGYLQWLAGHDASGAQFIEGESWKEIHYGAVQLVGKVDRIDRLADGSRMVLDYKTESGSATKARIAAGPEDTQLAFYAALLDDDTLSAAYVNLGEKEATRTCAQPDIVQLRDELINSILLDLSRIAAGAPLPALGEGKACEYCAARGLCRKDFFS